MVLVFQLGVTQKEFVLVRIREASVKKKKKVMPIWRIVVSIVGMMLVVAALREQLSLSPEQRTWQGKILGIPYDFRMPTPERIRERLWNKNTSSLVTPQLFGVGWSINFYPLFHPQPLQDQER